MSGGTAHTVCRMEFSGGSTMIMLLVAAVLWFAYLVPTWVQRREYLATERNATRLQQTLRIMAETAEVPREVRAEVSARDAAAKERLLRAQERERERARQARERAALAELARQRDPMVERVELARMRARRTRIGATVLLLAAIATAALQTTLIFAAGATTASWLVLGAAALGGSTALGLHRQLNRRRIVLPKVAPAVRPAPVVATPRIERPVVEAPAPVAWTPVPLPKPLYLSKPEHQAVEPPLDAERLMREASEVAQAALRARDAAAQKPAPVPIASKWAAMGIIDDTSAATPDLDEVLRRRRAAG